MLIDCDKCQMREIACADCVVGALIRGGLSPGESRPSSPRGVASADRERPGACPDGHDGESTASHHQAPGAEIGEPERRALRALADAGLVPPLRLVLRGAAQVPPAGGAQDPAGAVPGGAVPGGAVPGGAVWGGVVWGGAVPEADAAPQPDEFPDKTSGYAFPDAAAS